MSYRTMAKRLQELEAANVSGAVGVLDRGEDGTDAGLVQLCVPGGNGEHMTLAEWRRRYPDGTLIRVVYGDVDAGDEEEAD